MVNVIYVPLDERPCNAQFPLQIAEIGGLNVIAPPAPLLGNKKKPADCEHMIEWLKQQSTGAERIIVSIDMLVYGGIVPSRLHHLSRETCLNRLGVLREIKRRNTNLKIYAFNLIMRAPAYNSGEEEPDYYAEYGKQIFKYGWYKDKQQTTALTESEAAEWNTIKREVPESVLSDFVRRRSINMFVNRQALQLAIEHLIDFLVIPLDDNAEYGFAAMEQRDLLFIVDKHSMRHQVHMYPGADEVGCTLMSRVFCESKQYVPRLFVTYGATKGPYTIPKYEDRSLHESIKAQATAAGAVITDSPADGEAIVLAVNAPPVSATEQAEASQPYRERHRAYFTEMNYAAFAGAIRHYSGTGSMVALADVATCNGADRSFMQMAAGTGLLRHICAYAGWNTSGNSVGTAVSHAVIASYYRNRADIEHVARWMASDLFYICRLIDDWGYQALVRQQVCDDDLPAVGAAYFHIGSALEQVQDIVQMRLNQFIHVCLQPVFAASIHIDRVRLPWKRMFEVSFDVTIDW